jgi:hypothetical protein
LRGGLVAKALLQIEGDQPIRLAQRHV